MFKLEILSPAKPLFQGEVDMAILPGERGELGILKNHAPLLTSLKKGKIRVKQEKEEVSFEIESGFLEVDEKGVTVLVK